MANSGVSAELRDPPQQPRVKGHDCSRRQFIGRNRRHRLPYHPGGCSKHVVLACPGSVIYVMVVLAISLCISSAMVVLVLPWYVGSSVKTCSVRTTTTIFFFCLHSIYYIPIFYLNNMYYFFRSVFSSLLIYAGCCSVSV